MAKANRRTDSTAKGKGGQGMKNSKTSSGKGKSGNSSHAKSNSKSQQGSNNSTNSRRTQARAPTATKFITTVYQILMDDGVDSIVWSQDGKSLVITDQFKFQERTLPQYFNHSNIASFIRQLNNYGFKKTSLSSSVKQFSHPNFLKGGQKKLHLIRRNRENRSNSSASSKLKGGGLKRTAEQNADNERRHKRLKDALSGYAKTSSGSESANGKMQANANQLGVSAALVRDLLDELAFLRAESTALKTMVNSLKQANTFLEKRIGSVERGQKEVESRSSRTLERIHSLSRSLTSVGTIALNPNGAGGAGAGRPSTTPHSRSRSGSTSNRQSLMAGSPLSRTVSGSSTAGGNPQYMGSIGGPGGPTPHYFQTHHGGNPHNRAPVLPFQRGTGTAGSTGGTSSGNVVSTGANSSTNGGHNHPRTSVGTASNSSSSVSVGSIGRSRARSGSGTSSHSVGMGHVTPGPPNSAKSHTYSSHFTGGSITHHPGDALSRLDSGTGSFLLKGSDLVKSKLLQIHM
eukprot:g3491.t1